MLIRRLTSDERAWLDGRLEEYDAAHLPKGGSGEVHLGMEEEGRLVAALDGEITVGDIFYLSSLYVEPEYRGQGIGRQLVEAMEQEAAALGARMIRLDSFSYQGEGFYARLGYELVGSYEVADGIEERFYLKRL